MMVSIPSWWPSDFHFMLILLSLRTFPFTSVRILILTFFSVAWNNKGPDQCSYSNNLHSHIVLYKQAGRHPQTGLSALLSTAKQCSKCPFTNDIKSKNLYEKQFWGSVYNAKKQNMGCTGTGVENIKSMPSLSYKLEAIYLFQNLNYILLHVNNKFKQSVYCVHIITIQW